MRRTRTPLDGLLLLQGRRTGSIARQAQHVAHILCRHCELFCNCRVAERVKSGSRVKMMVLQQLRPTSVGCAWRGPAGRCNSCSMFRGQHLVLFVLAILSRLLSFTNNDLHHALDAVLGACICSPAAADPGSLLLH